jgi:hypothetical protein
LSSFRISVSHLSSSICRGALSLLVIAPGAIRSKNSTMATAEHAPAPREGGSSIVNRILLYLLLVGTGVIVGFGSFHALYKTSCTELLTVSNSYQEARLKALQKRFSKTASDHDACLQDETSKQKLHDLHYRLDAQTSLAGKYHDLLEKHEATLDKLNQVQRTSDASSQTVSTLHEQIKRLQRELGQSTVQVQLSKQTADKELDTLKEKLNLSRTMLREKQETLERSQKDNIGASSRGSGSVTSDRGGDQYKQELDRITTAIRRYCLAQCLLKYGKGPYTIQFTLDLPSEESSSSPSSGQNQSQSLSIVEVEFRLVPELAYTIWTILNLADLELYTGTTLRTSVDSDGGDLSSSVFGGHPKDAATQKVEAKLARRYAETGHGAEPFFMEELSPRAPCLEYTFGIIGKGPGFVVPLVPQYQDGSLSCPGRVVRGKETLQRLESLAKRDRVTIVNVAVITASSSSNPKEEL